MLGRLPAQLGAAVVNRDAPRLLQLVFWPLGSLLMLIALTAGWYAAQVAVLDWMQPRMVAASVHDGQVVHPDIQLRVSLEGYGAELAGAELVRSELSLDGTPVGGEQAIPVRLEKSAGGWQVSGSKSELVVRPDGAYRLLVHSVAPRPALPVPIQERQTSEYQFTTAATPRLRESLTTFRPRWGEPVATSWSLPLRSIEVSAEPPVPVRAWVDETDPTRAWVQVDAEAAAGGEHTVTFTRALAVDGMAMQQPFSFEVATPVRPSIVEPPVGVITVRPGQVIDLTSSVPLLNVQVESSGDLAARATVDGSRIALAIPQYRQGAEASVIVTGGVSAEGAPLAAPVSFKLRTPPAMELPFMKPDAGARAVPLRTRPYIEFDERPANPDAALRSVSMKPAVRGEWTWLDDVTMVFTPTARLPEQTEITVTLKGGPSGPLSAEGGYMEQDLVRTFVTVPNRRIEVSLSKQQLYMVEGEKVIRTITVGTGVRGAETPLGEYEVLYKVPVTRMQGVNPSGLRYDIPDVPWVLPFLGDYAIHGVHWRNNFGAPASNGCVGMTVAESKLLYDWADVGTPIRIYQ